MKKIGLITKNKILAHSLDAAIKAMPNLNFELFLLLNTEQTLLDAEIFEIDVALIDVLDNNLEDKQILILFCEKLKMTLPDSHLLFLVSQDDSFGREIANEAKEKKIIDDYVFYDASLKYLISKLAAF